MKYFLLLCLLILSGAVVAAPKIEIKGATVNIKTSRYQARVEGASLVYFRDIVAGEDCLTAGGAPTPFVRIAQNMAPVTIRPDKSTKFTVKKTTADTVRFMGMLSSDAGKVLLSIDVRALENEVLMSGTAVTQSPLKGIATIGFTSGLTNKQGKVIVPSMGGMAYDCKGLKSSQSLEWPISWEAPLVLAQGQKGGLLICAFDPFKYYKNTQINPTADSWSIAVETENQAPFEELTKITSLIWHFRPYSGDWRNGAKIYKSWYTKTFKPDINEDPAWVKDIRAEFHGGPDLTMPDTLIKNGIDPKQTIIYVPDWRTFGYDINYPDYTPRPDLAPFVEKAHSLGFKVMLHTNYFGVDPVSPYYPQFKPFQQKNKYTGELLFWEWTMSIPNTKIAYTDAASSEWRKFFVDKMVELVKRTGVDALHLDQTLCIVNDKNGLIEGMNNAEGSLLLHKELKAALPGVVISGEGLDEITSVHEGLAQRHVQGIDHVKGTFDKRLLSQCHPISAYLFGTRTKSYAYLGTPGPDSDQFYMAWCDAWRHWGVIHGSGWPGSAALEKLNGAASYEFEVIKTMQQYRLDPAMDGAWPNNADMPYSNKSGDKFAFISGPDGWSFSKLGESPVDFARVLTGVESTQRQGTVPGSITYDSKSVSGLDPEKYYTCLPLPRDLKAFHLEIQDPSCRVTDWVVNKDITLAKLDTEGILLRFTELMASGKPFWQRPDGTRVELTGEVSDTTGAICTPRGNGLFMHPPWKDGKIREKGIFGLTGISFKLDVPSDSSVKFVSECGIDSAATGKSDGAVFTVTAKSGDLQRSTEVLAGTAAPAPLQLDLSEFAGKHVDLEVTIDPGPKHDVSFDWGLLTNIKVLKAEKRDFACRVVWPAGMTQMVAPNYVPLGSSDADRTTDFRIRSGQSVMAVNYTPTPVAGTVNLVSLDPKDMAVISGVEQPVFIKEQPLTKETESVDGVVKPSLFAHPPYNGLRILNYFLTLPKGTKAKLTGYVGLRANSKSTGVGFRVWKNGQELWTKSILPADGWVPMEADLGEQTDTPIMLTLVTDAEGSHYYDWATWVDPVLTITK